MATKNTERAHADQINALQSQIEQLVHQTSEQAKQIVRLEADLARTRWFAETEKRVYVTSMAEFREHLELRQQQLQAANATEGRLGNAIEAMRTELGRRYDETQQLRAQLRARKKR